MCGIAGSWFLDWEGADEGRAVAKAMSDALLHRGPDDSGIWLDEGSRLALSHRRLSILDLSPLGHQPMKSACGRYVISFNGEIYNFFELREELDRAVNQKHVWSGHSDTEVVLEAISRWGLTAALKRFEGMFAFAVWDRSQRMLHLARDRFGEKPLYYGLVDGAFVFASELKALRAHSKWQGRLNRTNLTMYFRHGYVPAPYSIYEGIWKLPPGTALSLSYPKDQAARPIPYWSLQEVALQGTQHPFMGDDIEAIEILSGLLKRSVSQQMLADVPLGAFLSGGIDSSLVVGLMQERSSNPVKTFTIGFSEERFDESGFAGDVSKHLGTDHTELRVDSRQAMEMVPELSSIYDEPFGDSSQIPTLMVSRLARQSVTVSLSGDGGDELFGGYNHYQWGERIWKGFGWMPSSLRTTVGRTLLPISRIMTSLNPRVRKLAEVLALDSSSALYWGLTSHWREQSLVLGAGNGSGGVVDHPENWPSLSSYPQRMMYLDGTVFLPDDILVKLDRAGMRFSLETRAPLLSHKVAEFAWRLPLNMKIRNGTGKWLLRQVLYKYVPRALVDRPKMGFGVPVGDWLRGPLREWGEDLLSEKMLQGQDYLNAKLVRTKWSEHLSGRFDHSHQLWDVLMFQSWLVSGNPHHEKSLHCCCQPHDPARRPSRVVHGNDRACGG
jgi:asparagine synthase (glutamine-hydrolysing)